MRAMSIPFSCIVAVNLFTWFSMPLQFHMRTMSEFLIVLFIIIIFK